MNLLVYLRFLRPLRSLVVVAICTLYAGWLWGQNVLHLDHAAAWFDALAVALPLLLGFFIAGAAHEPMHRPFALVLPNIRRRQRAAAAVSVLIAAFAATCGAIWVVPTVSPVATFGLACAFSALPCLDRRQWLYGMAGGLAAFLCWLLLGVVAGAKLTLVLNAAPWLFLLGGMAISVASLARGFSRESLRIRSGTLFISYQTGFCSHLFHRGMVARWQAEVLAHRNRQGKGPSPAGRDWTVRSVGTTSLDWMRVFWHAKFGARKRNSFLHMQLIFAVMTLGAVAVLPGVAYYFGKKDYWAVLAQCAAPDMNMFTEGAIVGIGINFMMILPGMAMLCTMALVTPQLAYPISRVRLARVVFWQSVAQWAVALVVPVTSLFIASLLGQFMSGQFRPGYGLPALLAIDLSLAVLLPLMVAAGTVRGPVLRIITAVPVGMAIFLAVFSRPSWGSYILTLPAVLGVLAATAAGQWLLWHRLHRDYATADLTLDTGLAQLIRLDR